MGRAASRSGQSEPPGAGGLTPELSRELDRQHQAVQDSMERLLNQRLEQLERAVDPGGSPQRRNRVATWLLHIVVILGLAGVLVQLHLIHADLRELSGATPPPSPAQPEETAAPAGDAEAHSSPASSAADRAAELGHDGDWLAAWKTLVQRRPDQVAACFRDIEAGRDLSADQISDGQRNRFGRLATALSAGESIDSNLDVARKGVFEYAVLHGRDNGDTKLDLLVDSISEARLAELTRQLGITSFQQLDPKESQLQAAIAVMWILTHTEDPEP